MGTKKPTLRVSLEAFQVVKKQSAAMRTRNVSATLNEATETLLRCGEEWMKLEGTLYPEDVKRLRQAARGEVDPRSLSVVVGRRKAGGR